MKLNKASKEFGIPWTTLKRRIANGCFEKKVLGGPPVLTQECEKKIVKHIIKLQKFGFAPTMAYKLAEKCNQHHKYNREKQIAGMDWLQLFLKRNPELSIRKSEGVSQARSMGLNKKNVSDYFSLLQNILIEHNLLDNPGNIVNVDESGLQLNNRPGYVLAAKGSKSVPAITSGEKGETISVIACCNGEGMFLPPACVLKGKNEKAEYKDGMLPGSIIFMSQKSAYVTTDIFHLWLRNHFAPRKPDGTVVLILDGHSSHCSSVETLEFAEDNNIVLQCLPSHTTHYLQPLDRAFFKALKSYYYNACNSYIKMNPNRKVSRLVFGGLLSKSWVQAATTENAISGFRSTGVFPFCPDAIPEYAFLTSDSNQQQEYNGLRENRSNSPQPGCSHWQESRKSSDKTNTNQGLEHRQASPQLGCPQKGKNPLENICSSSEATDLTSTVAQNNLI
ncbi:MFS-type transporter clz9-like [Coccinella septempunctata]|uniref:MFS-type transporter clz9-like n=1 Tax=Coccinella septempunctata TaxID=41139 RepID=UPI001D07DB9B|nr:MFS-type transporter clz9-like [Coccinella septempunctata]XP_044764487.1 MFS-type transporter clz9-like [Coccinella septempunctata]